MRHTKADFRLLKTIGLALLLLLTGVNTVVGQDKAAEIDKLMRQYAAYGQFNGSVLVAEDGKIIYKEGFGMANMEWDMPNQPDTKFRLGSITKQFTAALILQLAEQGKLKLDVPISTYLPDYPKATGDKITIHHLLTHTSGIPNYTSLPGFMKDRSRDPYRPADFIKEFAGLPAEFMPGEKFAYSNSGYFLLGYIIETITGKSYEQCLKETIFTPLKMTSTGYDNSQAVLKKRAAGYNKNGNAYVNANYLDMTIPYAAGSLYSTVEDLYLWDQSLYTNQLLTAKSIDLMFGRHIGTGWGSGSYGYGWSINNFRDNDANKLLVTEHSGGINGFNTFISRIPANKDLVVLLDNTSDGNLTAIKDAITNILYDKPFDMPKMSLANTLSDIILNQGLDAGLKKFEELKNTVDYSVKEGEMNAIGYQFLQLGKNKEAIEVFRLNAAAFPKSGNAYDSLGEAYLKDGDKEQAIVNYKKSVELDPKNENGKKVLKSITE